MIESHPKLSTQRLHLRLVQDTDDAHIFQALSDPKVYRYYGVKLLNKEDTREQMDWYNSLIQKNTGAWWLIFEKSGDFVGGLGIYEMDLNHKRAEIGYWIVPGKWQNGYASEAMQKVMQYCWDQLELHRIEARVESENTASKQLLEKLGYQFEGRLNDFEIKDGKFISIDIYSTIRDENSIT